MSVKLVNQLHAVADTLAAKEAGIVRAGAGEILLLRSIVRDILSSIDQSRIAPSLRRRSQIAAQGFTE